MSAPVTGRVLRTRGEGLSLRVDGRALGASLGLAVALVAVMLVTLTTGEYELSVPEVLAALVGQGDGGAEFIVGTLRLPRLLTALFVGAALALSGAILQSLSGNPLGSPDVIGFTNGAATGALLVIIVLGGGMTQTAFGAFAGGLAAALLIYLLAFKGGVQGFRFILVGIGISALALSVNSYLVTRASLHDAVAAHAWLIGSVNGRGWEQVAAVGGTLAVLLPVALGAARRLSLLQLGDATATALGVGVQRSRLVLIATSVLLAAVATAAAGPIWFVALAAPQLARGLTRVAGPGLASSALMGGLLLTAGDLAVQLLFPTSQLPVGTATGCLGGLYLCWLLAAQWRKGSYT
ncbi:iron complex transport system permease protein [Prauserella shujinwangii]|uniref:Iron complex transport system permease protein n=1 Tax=Prauserella shujinwangii TaxID=1453103 RepID=A0A2T0LQ88_9PSEU|nr:iron chelate uptake ABC transporter family permease subunit [Prauserella shujinwangii]PRX45516.1 iron complex transport system permease protein [Prauserella shujinwangii]